MQEDIIMLIERTIGRNILKIDNARNISLYSQGINSLEMVQIVVAIEEKYQILLDSMLDKLNVIGVDDICDEVQRLIFS